MEKIIKDLIDQKEEILQLIETILFTDLNEEQKQRDLTEMEIKAINKARKKIYSIYKAIEILEDSNIK